MTIWLALISPSLATEADYRGSDAEMIRLRERLRIQDELDGREESRFERAIEKDYTVDVYGRLSNLEASITAEVLLFFAPDITDSISSILFVETQNFKQQVSSTSAVAFAHYSNVIAVKKPTCSTPVQSYDLRSYLIHEIAHIRMFNIHNYEVLFPAAGRSGTDDKRTLKEKWTCLEGRSGAYVGDGWSSLARRPDGFARSYGASDRMEGIATLVEITQLAGFHSKLDEAALRTLHGAYQGTTAHQTCLKNKLAKANAFRFLDDETAALVRDVWASSDPTNQVFLDRVQALRDKLRSRNHDALALR